MSSTRTHSFTLWIVALITPSSTTCAPTGAQVVELGVVNATIHKVNECVRVEDIDTLSRAYERIMELLLT